MKEPLDVQALALEVADANFADERLNRRLRALVAGLAADPTESLPQSFDSAGLEAAYRFFSNHGVTPDEILKSHTEATRGRCEAEPTFLVLHDSTTFSYRFDGAREGLGRGPRSAARGEQTFFAHVSLAVAADGTRRPLGVAALKTWVRGPTPGQVECDRWEEQIKRSSSRLNGRAKAIHVMDREADDYKMLEALIREQHRFVVRSQFNRLLHDSSVGAKMRDCLEGVCSRVEREVPLTRRRTRAAIAARQPARAARMAKLSVAAVSVLVKRTTTIRHKNTPMSGSLELNVVRVREAEPPPGVTPVEWILCTTEPIDTPEQQLTIVDYYAPAGQSRSTSMPSKQAAASRNGSSKTTKVSSICSRRLPRLRIDSYLFAVRHAAIQMRTR